MESYTEIQNICLDYDNTFLVYSVDPSINTIRERYLMEKIQAASLYGKFGGNSTTNTISSSTPRHINPKTGLAYSRKERRKLQRSLLKQGRMVKEDDYAKLLTKRESNIIFGADEK